MAKRQDSARRSCIGLALAAAGLVMTVVAGTAAPSGATPVTVADFTMSGPVVTPGDGTTTYTWTLVGSHPHPSDEPLSASHVVIATCLGLAAVSTNGGIATQNDPTTGVANGYKWEPNPAAGETFSITYPGAHDSGGTATWAVKQANEARTGTTAGPSCPTGDPEPEPDSAVVEDSPAPDPGSPEPSSSELGSSVSPPPAVSAAPVVDISDPADPAPEVLGATVENPRAVPSELAFTGPPAAAPLALGGLTLMATGAGLWFGARRRRPSPAPTLAAPAPRTAPRMSGLVLLAAVLAVSAWPRRGVGR